MTTARSISTRYWFSSFLAAGLCVGFCAQQAEAQSGTSFYHYNARTGRSYSQQVWVGRGSAYGGFSHGTPGRCYSAGSGYQGRSHYGGNASYNGYRGYRQNFQVGR